MKAILIPVKEFHEAKKRLAPHLSAADRAALAEAMCEDLFSIVKATSCADRVFVISKEPGRCVLPSPYHEASCCSLL